ISVSRVGGDAQIKAMKKVAGTLKITLAQYRSQAAFAMFASDLDPATRQQLTRGERLMELLKQPQYTPYPIEEQVVSVWAGSKGYLDDVPVEKVHDWEARMLDYVRHNSKVLETIASTGEMDKDLEAELEATVSAFTESYRTAENLPAGGEEDVPAEQARETLARPTKG
ncbi:MAG: F0F1 ATP synthase subunit alpha, partial [Actinotignum schaalii]|nr:F0F1 ATP synthase subunit alpha [Actinotignum schaalii]